MSGEKIMLCLDEAIEKRIDMLMMFQYLSEQNNGVVTDERIQNYGGKYIENACVPAGYDMSVCSVTTDRNGFESHSTPEGVKIQGVELAEFIRNNYTSLFE